MFFLLMLMFTQCLSQEASNMISVYGDVYADTIFFTRTFPWIIDNIGGDITVDFYMVGSGRYGVPQMCVLDELKNNTYLQAQYLKCEAAGTPSERCLCETGVDRRVFKQCVVSKGYLASQAAAKFSQLGIEVTPIIELSNRGTVFGVEDTWFLKKICTIFGSNLPRGCIKPFDCNQRRNVSYYSSSRAVAHFDRCCQKEFDGCFGQPVEQWTTISWEPEPQ